MSACDEFCGPNEDFPGTCVGWLKPPNCSLGESPESPRCLRKLVQLNDEVFRNDERPWMDDSTEDNYL